MTGGYILITSVEGAKKSALRVIELETQLAKRDALIKRFADVLESLIDGFEIEGDVKLDGILAEYRASVSKVKSVKMESV